MRRLQLSGEFFRQFRQNFRTTGSILPSGAALARAMSVEIAQPRPAARILEVGPGTGSVTAEILRHLQADDRLDAVEINPSFIAVLQKRFEEEPTFQQQRDKVTLIQSGIEGVPGESVYDFIVSGLPLNNFSPREVRTFFKTFYRLVKPGGVLTYFEYLWIRNLKAPFVGKTERKRLFSVGRVAGNYIREHQFNSQKIFVNVPPAIVRHLRIKAKL